MKQYIAKTNLPGCPKGTIINQDKHAYIYDHNKSECMYDCENEPTFFSPFISIVFKYKEGLLVSIDKKKDIVTTSNVEGFKNGPLSSGKKLSIYPSNTLKVVKSIAKYHTLTNKYLKTIVVVLYNGYYLSFDEKDLSEQITYYFINSEGIIHPTILNRDKTKDNRRKSFKNYFETKEEAQIKLDDLKKYIQSVYFISIL